MVNYNLKLEETENGLGETSKSSVDGKNRTKSDGSDICKAVIQAVLLC